MHWPVPWAQTAAYEGAVVVVSHDERFLAKIKVSSWLREQL